MDKAQAIQNWLEGYLPAYDQYTVKPDAQMPYITYALSLGVFDATTDLTVSVWYRTASWQAVTEKSSEIISDLASAPGILLKTDDGAIRLLPGQPAMLRMNDPDDDMVRRTVLNIMVRDYTAAKRKE